MTATGSRLDRWLKPRIDARAADTLRKIADDPTTVAHWRGGVQLDTLEVLVTSAPASSFSTLRGTASNATQASITILAPANTDLRLNDRLTASDNRAWVIKGVAPDRRASTEASAETA